MNFNKFILATLAAFIVLFLADWLWFGVIFKNWMASHMPPSDSESIPLHALAEFCFAALLAIVYPLGYKGGSPASEGIKFGLLMGLIYSLPGAIHHYAGMGGSSAIPVFFTANGVIMGILAGITVAMVYGGKSATAQA